MKILILRTSAMGDVVHCLPVLEALRRGLGEARIAWVVETVFAPLLEDHPDLDQIIPVRMRAWRKAPFSAAVRREIFAAVGAMRRFRADVALDLMGNHKGGVLAALSGARRKLGPARAFRREPSSAVWIGEEVETPAEHAVDRALEVLRPLGIGEGPVSFGGEKLMRHEPPEAEELLGGAEAPYFVIQAGAGWANKTYPPERWGEVAARLAEETGIRTLVPIAPGEEELAEAVATSSRGAARTVEARGLPLLAAILRRAGLVLGGDTGPIHLAHALGVPVLCVLGPTDPGRNGPYGSPEMALWRPLPCSFCYKRFAEVKACLLTLTPEDVVAQARRLLA